MKRIIILAFILSALSLILCCCSGKPSKNTVPSFNSSTETFQTTIPAFEPDGTTRTYTPNP